jgi:hypothetical protein
MLNVDHATMRAYNKMHVGFKVQVEWGIGGLKKQWRCFMKRFDSTKPKYAHLSQNAILLINFLHKRCMDFTHMVVGDLIINLVECG